MSTDEEKAKKARARYKRWYEKNKEKFNEKRRERYANDPDYQKRVKRSSAKTRKRNGG